MGRDAAFAGPLHAARDASADGSARDHRRGVLRIEERGGLVELRLGDRIERLEGGRSLELRPPRPDDEFARLTPGDRETPA